MKAVNEVQKNGLDTLSVNPDGAYWVDGLVVRDGALGDNPSKFGQIDAESHALAAASYLPVPRTGASAEPAYVSTPVYSPGNHSTPYVRHGLEWLDVGEEPISNTFSATLTNLREATLDAARMGFNFTQAINGAVQSDGPATLMFANIGAPMTLCVNGEDGVNVNTVAFAELVAGNNAVTLLPGTSKTCSGDGFAPVADYGPGLLGAIAQFFAELHHVVVALVSVDVPGAIDALMTALNHLAGNLAGLPTEGEANPVVAVVGDDPADFVGRETAVNRNIEAVVLTGDKVVAWSVPAAQGAPYPYPSGATISGAAFDPTPIPGQVRDAHNGVMVYPVAGAPMGVDVSRIAAYKFDRRCFSRKFRFRWTSAIPISSPIPLRIFRCIQAPTKS